MPNAYESWPPARNRVALTFDPDSSRTHQQFKKDCDINHIMARYVKTGVINNVNIKAPQYGIVPSVTFQEAMLLVANAQDTFDALPAEIRKEFGHDPGAFMDFVLDPENGDQLVEMGLAAPREPEPSPAQPEPSTPPAEQNTPPSEV